MENNNLLKIYKYGDDILKLKAKEIENIDGKIAQLVDRMTRTIHETYSAIGLAAPQVGESLRLSVIDLSMGENKDDQIVLINPEILEAEGNETGDEGCLSFPGISMTINRAARIFLKNFDMNGKEIHQEIDGFLARVIQHEIDHLDGTLIIDRVSSLKRQFVKKEIKRLQKDGEW
jgi:peptide deformylase